MNWMNHLRPTQSLPKKPSTMLYLVKGMVIAPMLGTYLKIIKPMMTGRRSRYRAACFLTRRINETLRGKAPFFSAFSSVEVCIVTPVEQPTARLRDCQYVGRPGGPSAIWPPTCSTRTRGCATGSSPTWVPPPATTATRTGSITWRSRQSTSGPTTRSSSAGPGCARRPGQHRPGARPARAAVRDDRDLVLPAIRVKGPVDEPLTEVLPSTTLAPGSLSWR